MDNIFPGLGFKSGDDLCPGGPFHCEGSLSENFPPEDFNIRTIPSMNTEDMEYRKAKLAEEGKYLFE